MALSPKTIRYAAWAGLNIIVARQVDQIVNEPYMDEPFHVPQAQAYCRGEWSTWDPKITTPPGLYLLSIFLMKIFLLPCKLPILRLTNVLVLTALPPLIDRVLSYIRMEGRTRSALEPSTESLIISSFPVAWFFVFLYYTDAPSAFVVLLTLWASRAGRHNTAAVLGLVSCLFRQTNIIWLVYALGSSTLHALHYNEHRIKVEENEKKELADRDWSPTYYLFDHDPVGENGSSLDWIVSLVTVAAERATFIPFLPPYAAACVAFVSFVIWNRGIVLGDKANHVPAIHIPQLYYFLATATAFGWPILIASKHGPLGLAKNVWKRMFGGCWQIKRTIFWTTAIEVTIYMFTIHHPFLLSDNRHYTFYLWRRIFMFHPTVPYLFAPVYLALAWAWFLRVGESSSLLTTHLLPWFCIPALFPAPLLEPRYFIIPYLLLRIQVAKQPIPKWALVTEVAWYALINWATMTVFLYWDRQGKDGVIRFMW